MYHYIIIVLSALAISFVQTLSTTPEGNLQYCLYDENCESCTCDARRCLECTQNDYICDCFAGMHYDQLNQTCVLNHHHHHHHFHAEPLICPKIPGGYGDSCNSSDNTCQFCGKHLECDHGVCRCKKGTYYKSVVKKCYVYPGESCEENKNCMENSICLEGVCKCSEGFLQDVQKCSLGYNATCHQVQKCHRGVHLECVKSVKIVSAKRKVTRTNFWKCKCIAEGEFYIWSKSFQKCVGLPGTHCVVGRDDCIVNANCESLTEMITTEVNKTILSMYVNRFRCKCNNGFAQRGKRCLRKCDSNFTDTTSCGKHQFCDKSVCTCESDKMIYDDCGDCKMPFGGACGIESKNYTCETGLICSDTCGKCLFPDHPPCTSSCTHINYKFSILIILLAFSVSINMGIDEHGPLYYLTTL